MERRNQENIKMMVMVVMMMVVVVVVVVMLVVVVVVMGGFCYKKPTIYLYTKNSAARFITILAPSALFFLFLQKRF